MDLVHDEGPLQMEGPFMSVVRLATGVRACGGEWLPLARNARRLTHNRA
jgi:hypothetical protein